MSLRARLSVTALLFLVLALVGLRVEVTEELGALLPAVGALPEALAELQRFQVADVLIIEVDGTGADQSVLIDVTDKLGEAFAADPLFREVRWRASVQDGAALQAAVAPHAVALIQPGALDQRLSEAGVHAALAGQRLKLLGPGGSMFKRALLADPLDLAGLALDEIRARSNPFRIQVVAGHFLDSAGTRAVLFVEPVASALATGPESTLLVTVDRILSNSQLPTRYIGGPRVAVEAARGIYRDVSRASSLGMLLLAGLLLWGFRSWRPIAGALGPTLLAGAATAAGVAVASPIHGLNLGFTAALLGVALDYWIHLYVAATALGTPAGFSARFETARRALRSIQPALLMSAVSTIGAFAVLLLSTFPAVRTLGVMGMAATTGALVGTWLLAPVSFALTGARPLPPFASPRPTPRAGLVMIGLIALCGLLAVGGGFNGDPRDLLYQSPEQKALERDFSSRYGGVGSAGIITVEAATLDRALDDAARVVAALGTVRGVTASGPDTLLPGPSAASERSARLPDEATLQARIEAAADDLGFAPEIFAGAAARIHAMASLPSPDTWSDTPLDHIARRHVRQTEAGWAVMVSMVVPESIESRTVREVVRAAAPGARVVIPSEFAATGVEQIRDELVRLGAVAAALILSLMFVRYREPRTVLAALLPSAAAIAMAGAGHTVLGVPWNAVSAGGMVLILGLSLDYGVFMVEASLGQHGPATARAVTLSALTTIAGFGTMVVAHSPALFGMGLAVLLGMLGAGLAALVLVPAVSGGHWVVPARPARWLRSLALAAVVLVNLDVLTAHLSFFSLPAPPRALMWPVESPSATERSYGPNRLAYAEGVWSARLVGDAYARGQASAALARDQDHLQEERLFETFRQAVPNPLARLAIVRGVGLGLHDIDAHFLPDQRAEIQGFTDVGDDPHGYLAPAYTRKIFYHAIHDIGQALVDSPLVVTACTGFMAGGPATSNGNWLLARNFDFDGGSLFDLQKTVTFVVPDEGLPYVSVSFASMVGVVTGLNAEGIAVALQAGASDAPTRVGMPMTLIAQELMQRAHNLDEVEAILDARRGLVAENVLVVDGDAGEAALFEVTPDQVERIDVTGSLAVSNHFRSPSLANDPVNVERQAEGSTVPRLQRMESLVAQHHGAIDLQAAAEILRDRVGPDGQTLPRGHRWAIDADIATHSAIIDATARRIWVSRFPNTAGGYVAYDLQDGLEGRIGGALVVGPTDPGGAFDRHQGRRLIRQARALPPADALPLAQRALALMPDHPEALQAVATALVALGRMGEAAPLVARALATPPEYAHQVHDLEALQAEIRSMEAK